MVHALSTDTVAVALAFNNDYCPIAAAALASLIEHTCGSYRYDIYVVSEDLSPLNQQRLQDMNCQRNVTLYFTRFDVQAQTAYDLNYSRHSRHAFIKLYLPHVLQHLKRVLYLDSDLLVLADVAKLFVQDLCGAALGAILDPLAYAQPGAPLPLLRQRGMPYDTMTQYLTGHLQLPAEQLRHYCNTGVMLIDLEKFAARLDCRLPDLLKQHFAFSDQDIINMVFCDSKQMLPREWNVFAGAVDRGHDGGIKELPCILHYAGGTKPCDDPRPGMLSNELYWQAVGRTPFFFAAMERYITARTTALIQAALQPHLPPPPATTALPIPRITRGRRRK